MVKSTDPLKGSASLGEPRPTGAPLVSVLYPDSTGLLVVV